MAPTLDEAIFQIKDYNEKSTRKTGHSGHEQQRTQSRTALYHGNRLFF